MDLEVIGEPETLRVGVLDCEQHVLRWHYSALGDGFDAHWQTPTMFLSEQNKHGCLLINLYKKQKFNKNRLS